MNTKVVKLDKEEIKRAIEMGDNCSGNYVIAINPETGKNRIHWSEDNRQWDNWGKNDVIFSIPALDPDGSGEASEDAEDMLRSLGLHEEAEAICDGEGVGWVGAAERLAPEDWEEVNRKTVEYLADEFLNLLNGNSDDDPAPWGYETDPWGQPIPHTEIAPPFEFEWQND